MAIQARLADGRVLNFPDGTNPEVINRTVRSLITPAAAAMEAEGVDAPMGEDMGSAIMAASGQPKPARKVYTGSVFDTQPFEPEFNPQEAARLSRREYAEKELTQPRRTQSMRATPADQLERSVGRAIADTGIGLLQGAAGIPKGIAANINAGDNPIAQFFDEAIQAGERSKSPYLQSQKAEREALLKNVLANQGELAQTRATFNSMFSPAGADVVSQGAGSMLPTLGMSLLSLGQKSFVAMNALANAGDAAQSTAQELSQMSPQDWSKSDAYQELRSRGLSHKDAVRMLAPLMSLPAQMVGNIVGGVSGATGLEKTLAGKGITGGARQRAARAGAELAGEELETLAPAVAGNITQRLIDEKKSITEGLGREAVETAFGSTPGMALAASGRSSPDALKELDTRGLADRMARERGFLTPEARTEQPTQERVEPTFEPEKAAAEPAAPKQLPQKIEELSDLDALIAQMQQPAVEPTMEKPAPEAAAEPQAAEETAEQKLKRLSSKSIGMTNAFRDNLITNQEFDKFKTDLAAARQAVKQEAPDLSALSPAKREILEIADKLEAAGVKGFPDGMRLNARPEAREPDEKGMEFYRSKLKPYEEKQTAPESKTYGLPEFFSSNEKEVARITGLMKSGPLKTRVALGEANDSIQRLADTIQAAGFDVNNLVPGQVPDGIMKIKSQIGNIVARANRLAAAAEAVQKKYKRADPARVKSDAAELMSEVEGADNLIAEDQNLPPLAETMEGVAPPVSPEVEDLLTKQRLANEDIRILSNRSAGTSLMKVLEGSLKDGEISELGGKARKIGKNPFISLVAKKGKPGSSMEDMVNAGSLDLFLPIEMRPGQPGYANDESAEYIREKLRAGEFYTDDIRQEIDDIQRGIWDIEAEIQQELTLEDINREIQYAVDEQRELDQEAAPAPAEGAPETPEEGARAEAEAGLIDTPAEEAAPIEDKKVRDRLMQIAKNLGVQVFETDGRPMAGGGFISIPFEDKETEGAVTPEHVFAHELGHAIMQNRGMSFNAMPKEQIEKWIPGFASLKEISKKFRPAIWSNKLPKIRRHANKNDEIIADALGSYLLGDSSKADIAPLIKGIGLTEYDLGEKKFDNVANEERLIAELNEKQKQREEEQLLKTQTEQELRDKQAEVDKVNKENERLNKEAEAKAKADEQAGNFVLTGSKREADEAAARGQQTFFDITPAKAPSTDSAAFKRWFGDSKVVDENGEPLVVYHGTGSDIDVFRPSEGGSLGEGIYFTDDADAASRFAERKEEGMNVLPAYIKAERILDADNITDDQLAAIKSAIPKNIEELVELGYPQDLATDSKEFIERDLKKVLASRTFNPKSLWLAIEGGPTSVLESIYKAAGFDSITRMSDGLVGQKPFREYLVFRPTQIKSAIGNIGTYDPNDANISKSLEEDLVTLVTQMADEMAEAEKKRSPSLVRTLKTYNRQRNAGKMSEGTYIMMSDAAIRADEERRLKEDPKDRERGYLHIQERLSAAVRRDELSREAYDLANWFMRQNENLVTDLGVSIKGKGPAGAGGFYNGLSRVMTLIKEGGSDLTATHEILHHLERMMPAKVQQAIRKAWLSQLTKAAKTTKDPVQKLYFEAVLDANLGNNRHTMLNPIEGAGKAYANARMALEDMPYGNTSAKLAEMLLLQRAVPIDMYRYFNPSEFWAVNGSEIVQGRFDAVNGGVLARLKNWLGELGQKIKSLLGLKSNAPIIRALDSLNKADGKFQTDEMLSKGDNYASLEDDEGPKKKAQTKLDDTWLLGRDKAGNVGFGPGAKAYGAVANIANAVLDKVGMKPVSPELGRAMRNMKARVDQVQNKIGEVAVEMNKLSKDEREMISDIIEGELKAGVHPPQHVLNLAASIQSMMSRQAKELVDLGMLSKEAANRWDNKYLPRFYENKLRDEVNGWAKATRDLFKKQPMMRGIKGSQLRARGLFEVIDANDLQTYIDLGWEQRDPEFNPKTSTATVVWRDYDRAERESMGEIRDAMFRFVMGYNASQRDIALGRLYKDLAENYASEFPLEGYVQVPETKAEGTQTPRYGKLEGLYVPKEVMDHLSANDASMASGILKLYRAGLSKWKEGKTVLNPVSHANNVISNVTMAHFSGVSYWDAHKYAGAIKDFVTGSKMIKEAKDVGVFGGSFNNSELVKSMPPELKAMANMTESRLANFGERIWDTLAFTIETKGKKYGARPVMQWAYEGEDMFFRYLIYRDARQRGMEPEDARDYSQEYIFTYDDLPKGARALRDYGMPFFSYTYKVVPVLARTALVYPWRYAAPATIAYTANALMYAIAANMGGNDDDWWTTTLYKYLTDEEFRKKAKAIEAEERKLLPEWMKGQSAILSTPKAIRMGVDEVTKLPMFLDISRIFPGGDLLDANNNSGGVALLQPLTPSNPVLTTLVAMLANKDMFLGKDVVKKTDTDEEKAQKRAAWLWKQTTPAIAVGNYHFDRTMGAIANMTQKPITIDAGPMGVVSYTGVGKDGLPVQPKLAMLQTMGIKVRPYDLELSRNIEESNKKQALREIDLEIKRIDRQESKNVISSEAAEIERDKLLKKKGFVAQGLTPGGKEK
jgi:hypothetical protein